MSKHDEEEIALINDTNGFLERKLKGNTQAFSNTPQNLMYEELDHFLEIARALLIMKSIILFLKELRWMN